MKNTLLAERNVMDNEVRIYEDQINTKNNQMIQLKDENEELVNTMKKNEIEHNDKVTALQKKCNEEKNKLINESLQKSNDYTRNQIKKNTLLTRAHHQRQASIQKYMYLNQLKFQKCYFYQWQNYMKNETNKKNHMLMLLCKYNQNDLSTRSSRRNRDMNTQMQYIINTRIKTIAANGFSKWKMNHSKLLKVI